MAGFRASIKRLRPGPALAAAVRVDRYLRRTPTETRAAALYRRVGRPATISGGPFRGMLYVAESTCGAILPKVLGTYELELQPLVESAIAAGPDLVVDVDRFARYLLKGLAARNGMGERVEIRGECTPETLGPLLAPASRPLVICDCEGYEDVLLDPARCPGLAGAWVVVELHDFNSPGVSSRIMDRFRGSHDVEVFDARERSASDCPDRLGVPDDDLALALSEWRPPGMRWYSMKPRAWARPGAPR